MAIKVKITLVKSPIDRPETQKLTVKGLGLRKVNSVVVKEDTPAIRGMIRKIQHLVAIEPVE
jgi:large subunit ribosomal protein L30